MTDALTRLSGLCHRARRFAARRFRRIIFPNDQSDIDLHYVEIDIERLYQAMPRLFPHVMRLGLNPNWRGYEYFQIKHEHLLAFFAQCASSSHKIERDNAYLQWMEHHAPDYRECATRVERLALCIHYRDLYFSVKNDGLREPLVVGPRRGVRLPGVYDGGNRLAIMRSLNIRQARFGVNRETLEIARSCGVVD